MFIPLGGYAPDADPRDPGVVVDTDLTVPTLTGLAALAGDSNAGAAAVASTVAACVAIKKLDNTNRIFAATQGTASKIYELSTASWNDRTHAAGTYSATAAARWTFCQYKDITVAAQKGEPIQASGTSGASLTFKTVVGAPKARIVEVVNDFVMAFNVDDGGATYGNDPQRWWCAAAGDHTSWTPSVATLAATGELNDTPGPITAAKRLGGSIVVYKQRSMYVGNYVGVPEVFRFTLVPGEGLGTWSPYSVVDIETAHLFIGYDNVYLFDGTRPQPIGTNRVAKKLLADIDIAFADRIVGFHHRQAWQVFWWYPSIYGGGVGTLDRYICYNYRSDRWSAGIKTVQFAFNFLEPGIDYNTVGTLYSTYNDIPSSPYDSLFSSSGTEKPAIVNSDTVYKLEGAANACSITTGDIGTDGVITLINRVRPRFKDSPTTGTAVRMYKDQSGGSETTLGATITLTNGAYDHVWSARWHRYKASFTGSVEVVGLDVEIQEDGLE